MSTTFDQADVTVTLKPIPDDHGECRRCHDTAEDCMCGRGSYYEMYAHDTQEMVCNLCGYGLHLGPCPLHAPREVPGLYRIPCEASPQHTPVFIPNGDGTPYAMCPYCQRDFHAEAHEGCEHAGHGRWRAWRMTWRLVRLLDRLRIVDGYSSRFGHGCKGCVKVYRRRSR